MTDNNDSTTTDAPVNAGVEEATKAPLRERLLKKAKEGLKLTKLMCTLERDAMVKIPISIYAHELPIYQELDGADKVEVVSEKEVSAPEGFTVDDEYDRLIRKFSRSKDPDIVRKVYGRNPKALAEQLDIPYRVAPGARTTAQLPQSLVVDNSVG